MTFVEFISSPYMILMIGSAVVSTWLVSESFDDFIETNLTIAGMMFIVFLVILFSVSMNP